MVFSSKGLCCFSMYCLNSHRILRFVLQQSRARLFKEYKEVQREKVADPDIQLACDDSNIFKWTALIKVKLALAEHKYVDMVDDNICTQISLFSILRDHQRLPMKVVCSNLLSQFLSSTLCSLHKWGFWPKYSIQMYISRYGHFVLLLLFMKFCLVLVHFVGN